MKRKTFFLISTLIFGACSFNSIFFPSNAPSQDTNDILKFTYRFEEPQISQAGEYARIGVAGLRQYTDTGKPVLPVKTVKILLPYGKTYSKVKVYPSPAIGIKGEYLIEPGQSPYISQREKKVTPDPEIYSSSQPYPADIFEVVTVQNKKGYRILFLNIFPVRYIPLQGKLDWCREIEVEVYTRPAQIAGGYRGLSKDEKSIMKQVSNPKIAETYPLKEQEKNK